MCLKYYEEIIDTALVFILNEYWCKKLHINWGHIIN